MKDYQRVLIETIACCFLIMVAGTGYAADAKDKSLSPYFFMEDGDPTIDHLPLKSTDVQVNIAGVIANVTVTQKYGNEGNRAINGSYIFPASTKAAVHGMTLKIGDEIIKAKIMKKEVAKEEFKAAQKAGKSASLLIEHRPNVFSMKVANIMPGDELEVVLEYTELIEPRDGAYDFIFPTVVGPRYSKQTDGEARDHEKWLQNPYLPKSGEEEKGTTHKNRSLFNIDVHLAATMALQEAKSLSHQVLINYQNKQVADISLANGRSYEGDRDYILKYRLAGKKIQSGLMFYEHDEEKYFLMMMEPPERTAAVDIVPREYVFLLDVSGSMDGFPLNTAKKLLIKLTAGLGALDRFNMLFFAGGSKVLSPVSLEASSENISMAVQAIENQRGGGGTEFVRALRKGIALPQTEGVSRVIVVITDGYISFEKEAFDLIRENLNHANVFAFGVGSSVNRYLVEGIAKAGMGAEFVATGPKETDEVADRFHDYISSPVLTNIEIKFHGFDTYAIEPIKAADIFASRPIIVHGKYRGKLAGEIVVSGKSGRGEYEDRIQVADNAPDNANSALRYLWARKKIARLSDYNSSKDTDTKTQIATLGLSYNLLTTETSFIAVSERIRNPGGQADNIKHPLPLPKHVSNLAIGGHSVPEPGFHLLLASLIFVFIIREARSRCLIAICRKRGEKK